jgi:hypothetical protein
MSADPHPLAGLDSTQHVSRVIAQIARGHVAQRRVTMMSTAW